MPAIMLAEILLGGDGIGLGGESSKAEKLLPLGGISRTETVLCNRYTPHYVTYHSDEHGFRNPPGVWDVRARRSLRWGVADAGYYVPDGKGFVDLL